MLVRSTPHARAPAARNAPCVSVRSRGTHVAVQANASQGGVGLLQRIGRVLREKAAGDIDRFVNGTQKTRERLGLVEELFTFWSLEDYEDQLEELEEALIAADFGPRTALQLVDGIRASIKAGKCKTGDELRAELKRQIVKILGTVKAGSSELRLVGRPAVVLVVGVNGAGKTTTIGKIASKLQAEGARVYLAPGDTFRAAAAEQLAEWAERSGAIMGPFEAGAKPYNLLAKCVKEAKARGDIDVVIADTSGRLHTAYDLMEELEEVKKKLTETLGRKPDEVLLVLDGTTGLNMLTQAKEFHETVGLTGLVLTKLDGSARGGAVLGVVQALGVPVKFVGVGEAIDDLQSFDPASFADALFPEGK